MGIVKSRAVNVSVGATIITTLAALLVLAVIVRMHNGGTGFQFWLRLGVGVAVSFSVIFFAFPLVTRWFMKRFDDNVAQYVFVLALVFMGAFLAQIAGIEPILGAFLTGLALNRLIPNTSPLMNRIEFVGNALFIPFFLISVGMLIDFRTFFSRMRNHSGGCGDDSRGYAAKCPCRLVYPEDLPVFNATNARTHLRTDQCPGCFHPGRCPGRL